MFEMKLATKPSQKILKMHKKWFKIIGLVFKAGLPIFSCTKSQQ
jgi:hypothetical protein